jgi:hypothetical protein
MRVDLSIDTNSTELLAEPIALVLSCIAQGESNGVSMHPGMTIEWTVTTDEDAFV